MDVWQLLAELDKAGVDRSEYYFPGMPPRESNPDGGTYLEVEGGRWQVKQAERGQSWTRGSFDTEDEACRFLYDLLTWKAPEPYRQTPEEAEASRLHNERRQAEDRRNL
ncbi:hypothetical protein ACFQ05_34970 [Amycolatopsis umgeniensis]|uniref:Uncharacterized protein n=1 Tax=Amycolatopsis umgeniensis TaxID=336628 RepID=A0A841BB84_9PSEU|nr:hypothetical protein [Amycolatopsis umgeniensis]MBB5855842.1 hypothetical protein [Amycolatopsis umgeniensis]